MLGHWVFRQLAFKNEYGSYAFFFGMLSRNGLIYLTSLMHLELAYVSPVRNYFYILASYAF